VVEERCKDLKIMVEPRAFILMRQGRSLGVFDEKH
jgi:hypothetical protein